ncbi:MAG: transporter related protein [Frankiales bacterium]|nr:transporter related protein [Frankiales bacterium]
MTGDRGLRLSSVSAGYTAHLVLRDVDIELSDAQICAVLGRNGAGKSTLARVVMGELRPRAGTRTLDGIDLPRQSWRTARRGIAMVPEGRGTVPELTVAENLLLGAGCSRRRLRAQEAAVFDRFAGLAARRGQVAGTLSGGEQQMLAIGRAMAASPRVIVMDEPTLGLAPKVITELWAAIEELRSSGVSILLLEQNSERALDIADFAYVLNQGRIVAAGDRAELARSDELRAAFLN